MIVRIVKLTFKTEEVENFEKLFAEVQPFILKSEGCRHVELLRDVANTSVFFTYSHWDDDAALENYRNSDFFKVTWAKTRALFADKAEAWSLEKFVSLRETTTF